MKKIIKLTESDLVRIIKRVIKEQNELPRLKPNEFITPDGTIIAIEVTEVTPITVQLGSTFDPGRFEVFEPSPGDDGKLKQIADWLRNPILSYKNVTIAVTAGSSKIPPADGSDPLEYNKNLSKQRGETGLEYVKEFLRENISNNLYEQINFVVDVSQAYKGPEYVRGTNNKNDPKYRPFQFVTVTATMTGKRKVETKRKIIQKYRSSKSTQSPNISFIEFCIKGYGYVNETYMCKGWQKVYISNYDPKGESDSLPFSKMRWLPLGNPSQGLSGSDFYNGKGVFSNGGDWCFQYEFSNAINQKPNCAEKLESMDDYSYKYDNNEIPGEEVGPELYQEIIKNWKTSTTMYD